MTKIKLDGAKRTILRSRVRRHPGAAGHDVATLSNPDLVQLALQLGVVIPSDAADLAYRQAKDNGATTQAAMAAADSADDPSGLTIAPVTSKDADAVEADADADDKDAPASVASGDAQPAAQTKADADPVKAAASAAVADVLARFGAGDMVGFRAGLDALALAAKAAELAPPAPVAAPVGFFDPSKVAGHLPVVIGRKTMQAAGIQALPTALDAFTALDVYDAPDAPAVDPAYVWPDDTALAMSALAQGNHVFLTGPAGTGKTTWAQQLAARYGRPFNRISCDDQTEAATLVGMTVPDPKGGVRWQDGQLAQAIRRPGTVILLDEPSVARPGALMVMQALLDGARALRAQETGELIPVAPGVLFIAADNTNGTGDETGQYEGTRRLNRAFLDRFAYTVAVDYLPTPTEAQVLAKRTGIKPAHALTLAKFAAATRLGTVEGKVSHGIGLRTLCALASGIVAGGDPARVFQLAAISKAPFEDREPLRQMWEANVKPGAFK